MSQSTKIVLLAVLFGCGIHAFAADEKDSLMKDFDSLGGNDVLYEKAQALQPESKIEIVQNRVVDRKYRHEFAGEFEDTFHGDNYLRSRSLGINYHFHITPRWSLGLRYSYGMNELTDEAKRSVELAETTQNREGGVPDIDWMTDRIMASVSYYPIYGKFNFFDLGVVHFDLYGTLGAGEVTLSRGSSSAYTAGAGIGMWFSQHLTGRFEMRYETYQAQRITGDSRDIELTIAGFQLGYML